MMKNSDNSSFYMLLLLTNENRNIKIIFIAEIMVISKHVAEINIFSIIV